MRNKGLIKNIQSLVEVKCRNMIRGSHLIRGQQSDDRELLEFGAKAI
jgi:hypothetical protein